MSLALLSACNSDGGSPVASFFDGLVMVSDSSIRALDDSDLENAEVVAVESGATTFTDSAGQFQFTNLRSSTIRITLQNGFSAVYTVEVLGDINQVSVVFFLEPIFARSSDPLVTVLPSADNPNTSAEITRPQDQSTILCVPIEGVPSECILSMIGSASRELADPDANMYAYIASRPVSLQVTPYRIIEPALNVDSGTGLWTTDFRLVEPGKVPTEGQKYELSVIVTSQELIDNSIDGYDEVSDIPGFTSSSEKVSVITSVIGPGIPSVRILDPQSGFVGPDTTLQFRATAIDPEDGALTGASLEWFSSIDGSIGTGTEFDAVLSAPAITCFPETVLHNITLRVTDNDGHVVIETTQVAVGTIC